MTDADRCSLSSDHHLIDDGPFIEYTLGGSVNHNLITNPDAIAKKFETQKLEQKLVALLLSGNIDAWDDGDSTLIIFI